MGRDNHSQDHRPSRQPRSPKCPTRPARLRRDGHGEAARYTARWQRPRVALRGMPSPAAGSAPERGPVSPKQQALNSSRAEPRVAGHGTSRQAAQLAASWSCLAMTTLAIHSSQPPYINSSLRPVPCSLNLSQTTSPVLPRLSPLASGKLHSRIHAHQHQRSTICTTLSNKALGLVSLVVTSEYPTPLRVCSGFLSPCFYSAKQTPTATTTNANANANEKTTASTTWLLPDVSPWPDSVARRATRSASTWLFTRAASLAMKSAGMCFFSLTPLVPSHEFQSICC